MPIAPVCSRRRREGICCGELAGKGVVVWRDWAWDLGAQAVSVTGPAKGMLTFL